MARLQSCSVTSWESGPPPGCLLKTSCCTGALLPHSRVLGVFFWWFCAQALSRYGERGLLFHAVCRLLTPAAALNCGPRAVGTRAQWLRFPGLVARRHMASSWTTDVEPMSPALAGDFYPGCLEAPALGLRISWRGCEHARCWAQHPEFQNLHFDPIPGAAGLAGRESQ